MIHSLFGNSQNQNQDFNIQKPKENLKGMKKGVMVNGSEVYYGMGRKDVNSYNYYKNKSTRSNGNYARANKMKSYNNTNQIISNKQINFIGKEDNTFNSSKYGKIDEIKTHKVKIEKKVENKVEYYIDPSQPTTSLSIRLYNGDVVSGTFNSTQKLRDIYLYVKEISHRINFDLLEGFPPKPLKDYTKTILELGLENSMLTQKVC